MNRFIHFFFLHSAFLLTSASLSAEVVVSNVRAEQRVGTNLVDVYYDVTANAPTVTVSLAIRDGLETWGVDVPAESASGHIGEDVPVGEDRHIVWDAGEDWPWRASYDMQFDVTATSTDPVIELSGDLAFGDVDVGQSSTRTLTITNIGYGPLDVSSINYPVAVFSGNWSGTIAAGGSQNVTVTFAPTGGQAYSGNLTVASNATSGTNTRAVSGTGLARIISLSGNLAFGNVAVGQSVTRTLTICNTGNSPLIITSISYPNAVFSGNWSGTIPPGGCQNVTVTFAPTALQSYSGNLTVASNATSGTNTRAVTGTGVAATRVISLSGDLAFGNVVVGQSATRTLTITNTGNSSLSVTSISYPNAVFSGNWSGTIAAGGSQNVTVTFAPTAGQSYSGNLTVASNATSGTHTRAVSGTGLTRVISLSGDLGFGNVVGGQSATSTLNISNTGNSPLSVTSISYPNAVFSGNWSGTIAAGGSQNVTVTFAPTAIQSYSGNLTVASDSTSGTNTRAVSGTGVAPPGMPHGGDPTATTWVVVNTRWVRNNYANGHITMSDRDTGLMWVYDAGANGTANWSDAQAHCNNLSYAGHSDWFLPNLNQLAAMWGQKAVFTNVKNARYWSSSRLFLQPFAYFVDMAVPLSIPPEWDSMGVSYWIWPSRSW